jgi:hypothetical protein
MALTEILAEPVIVLLTMSVTVTVCVPEVAKVTLKAPTPFVIVEFAGRIADGSVELKWTVPLYPVTVLPNASSAVTVTLSGVPIVALGAANTAKCVTADAATETCATPVTLALPVSVTEIVCEPEVLIVTLKVRAPFVKVVFAGKVASESLEVKWTVPLYPVTVLPDASSAVTVTLNGVPAVALVGAETEKCVAGAAIVSE